MLNLFIGLVIGGTVGLTTGCLMISAKNADREIERLTKELNHLKNNSYTLLKIKGKFLLSYNDCPEIRELWDRPGIYIEEISRLHNLAQRYESGCMYNELFISNYRQSERRTHQLSMFDEDTGGI